ncbi:MAG: PriCT-2 domain-containing protein [Thiotrichaceae bacterium]
MNPARIHDIDNALRFIPAEERNTWVRVGMALKSELGDSGYSLWDYWSQSAASYQERAAQLVWRSFKSGGTKIGTLYHIAKQHGYRFEKAPARVIPEKKPLPPQKSTGKYAAEIWLKADCSDKAVATHPYAVKKGIRSAGGAGRAMVSGRVVGKNADCIVIPIRHLKTNKVVAVQCVNVHGDKQAFGPVSGNTLLLGNTLNKHLSWFVAEGWASSYSMVFHHCHGNGCCAVAFGKGNLDTIAQRIAEVYEPERLVIIREQDA